MPHFKTPTLVQTEHMVVYKNMLLDPDFSYYEYHSPLPVLLGYGNRQQVGKAYLAKAGSTLYGELRLDKRGEYSHLYPYLPFDLEGHLTALILSHFTWDDSIKTLIEQLNESSGRQA